MNHDKNINRINQEKYKNKLISILKRVENHDQVHEVLLDAVIDGDLVQHGDHITYICGDFIVMDRLRFGMEQSVEMLKALTEKHFTIFPRYVFSLEIENYCLLITRIPWMNGKELIPIYKGYHLIPQIEKEKAYNDIQRLVKNGLVIPQTVRGDYAWYIIPDTKQLIIPNWNIRLLQNNEEGEKSLKNTHWVLFKKMPDE